MFLVSFLLFVVLLLIFVVQFKRTKNQINEGQVGDVVIILGGSLAGMQAAAFMSKRFKQVILIDRDSFPDAPEARRGVPQSNHLHTLLRDGLDRLEQILPGLEQDLKQAGAYEIDITKGVRWFQVGGYRDQTVISGVKILMMTRPLLEFKVRNRLLQISNVEIKALAAVTGLVTSSGGSKVIKGVTIRNKDGSEEQILGDLIIDCMGRNTLSTKWLGEMGIHVTCQKVNAHLGYTSAIYEIPRDKLDYEMLIIHPQLPNVTRGFLMEPIEGTNRYICLFVGFANDHPPSDEEGLKLFVQSTITNDASEALAKGHVVEGPWIFKQTENRRYSPEKCSNWPERFVLLGDSLVAFNPSYAQGITSAGIHASLLDKLIGSHKPYDLANLAKEYNLAVKSKVDDFWLVAASEDYKAKGVEATEHCPLLFKFLQWYMDKVMRIMAKDPQLFITFSLIFQNLIPPVPTIFHPRLIMMCIKEWWALRSSKKSR